MNTYIENHQSSVQLTSNVSIEQTFYDLIYQQVTLQLPLLEVDRVYETHRLLPEEFPEFYEDEFGSVLAAMCIKHMTECDSLPLIAINRGDNSPIKYVLK